MRLRNRTLVLVAVAALLLVLPPIYLLTAERAAPADPVQILVKYLKASYARDYKEAYHFISSEDRRLKDEQSYIREQGPFTGFTLDVARKLADLIEAAPLETKMSASRAHINLKLRLPDANKLSAHLMNWDEERLNNLTPKEQMVLFRKVNQWSKEGDFATIEGEQGFDLIKEKGTWRVLLNWAAGTQVTFHAEVAPSLPLEVVWEQREVITRPGEIFNVHFRVKNASNREIFTKIPHRVEPKELAPYLELVECGLFSPMKLLPRQEQEYASTYLLRADLPHGIQHLAVTYGFADVR
jgi:hypothetical protein